MFNWLKRKEKCDHPIDQTYEVHRYIPDLPMSNEYVLVCPGYTIEYRYQYQVRIHKCTICGRHKIIERFFKVYEKEL